VKMDHTSVLYALRQMGLYDSEAQNQARRDDKRRRDDIHARHEAERRAQRETQQTKRQRTWAERKADQRVAKLVRDRAYYAPSPQRLAVIAKVAAIKAQLSAGIGADVVAERFAVSRRYVQDIQSGRRWASLEPERAAA
jgi:type IV secretory pathway VirB10-like protein